MGRWVRYLIIAALVALQAATISALWLVSGSASESAVEDHLTSLVIASADQAALQTTSFLQPAEDTINIIASMVRTDGVDTHGLEDAFLSQLQRTPQLAGLFVASPDGEFLFVSRDGDDFQTKTIDGVGSLRTVEIVRRDADATEQARWFDPRDDYNPVERVWYRNAVDGRGGIAWSDPYVFFTSGVLGTTAAVPVDVDGRTVAVVGVDIELESLSEFLATLPMGERGGAVITTAAGTMIAHPDPTMTRRTVGGEVHPNVIAEIDDPVARLAAESMDAVAAIDASVSGVVPISTQPGTDPTVRATSRSIDVGTGRWSITIHADSRDFVGDIKDGQRRDRQFLLAIGGVAALVGALAMFPATRPIARLAHEAATDPLTQVDNRRSITQRTQSVALERGAKTVALVDVDGMREVNRAYGQLVGDEVLAEVADRLRRVVGSHGYVGRIAGEEFLLVFPRRSWDEVEEVLEGARRSVRERPVNTSQGDVALTVSIGVASDLRRIEGDTLIRAAVDALTQAKRFGSDRVRVSHVGEDAEGLTHITVDLTGDTSVTRIVVPGTVSD